MVTCYMILQHFNLVKTKQSLTRQHSFFLFVYACGSISCAPVVSEKQWNPCFVATNGMVWSLKSSCGIYPSTAARTCRSNLIKVRFLPRLYNWIRSEQPYQCANYANNHHARLHFLFFNRGPGGPQRTESCVKNSRWCFYVARLPLLLFGWAPFRLAFRNPQCTFPSRVHTGLCFRSMTMSAQAWKKM